MQEASHRQSAASQAGGGSIPWGWVVGTAIGLEVALVISAFVWVAIYSYLIHPGEDPGFYQRYAQFASPVVSIVLGMPYWYLVCRWVGRKAGNRAVAMCLWAWVILFVIDLPLNFLAEHQTFNWVMVAISHPTKLIAAYLGGRAALKHAA
jgi:hypothetical protein